MYAVLNKSNEIWFLWCGSTTNLRWEAGMICTWTRPSRRRWRRRDSREPERILERNIWRNIPGLQMTMRMMNRRRRRVSSLQHFSFQHHIISFSTGHDREVKGSGVLSLSEPFNMAERKFSSWYPLRQSDYGWRSPWCRGRERVLEGEIELKTQYQLNSRKWLSQQSNYIPWRRPWRRTWRRTQSRQRYAWSKSGQPLGNINDCSLDEGALRDVWETLTLARLS